MVINNYNDLNFNEHVKFVAYTGVWPNLCFGTLTLEIDGKEVVFGYGSMAQYRPFWSSGGGMAPDYDIYSGEWIIDAERIPDKYRQYAEEINSVFNNNVPQGCCGGCI